MVEKLKRSDFAWMCIMLGMMLMAPIILLPLKIFVGTMLTLAVKLLGGFFATCWNYSMPSVFQLPAITDQQAFAMLLIAGMLRGIKKEAWEELREDLKSVGADFKATFTEGATISNFKPVDLGSLRRTDSHKEKSELKSETKKDQEEEPKGNAYNLCEKIPEIPEVKTVKMTMERVATRLRK